MLKPVKILQTDLESESPSKGPTLNAFFERKLVQDAEGGAMTMSSIAPTFGTERTSFFHSLSPGQGPDSIGD